MAVLSVAQVSFAGDEDISPSAYQIFDPETGYMIPVEPQTNPQQGHGPSPDDAQDDAATGGGKTARRLWLYLPILLIVLALGATRLRKKRAAGGGSH
ncbi:MAG: hypothetical protein WD448_13570 [Woeseia sp.]